MPCKVFQQPNNCLRENDSLQFSEKNADTFKDFCSNLATDLVNQLSATENIFGRNSVKECYSALNIWYHWKSSAQPAKRTPGKM